MNRLLCCLAAGLLLAACSSSTDTLRDRTTGLEGQVVAGPTCPVVRPDDVCADRPFRAFFDVYDARGAFVTRFMSDDQGFFSVALEPGRYVIVPEEAAPILNPRSQRMDVTVREGEMTQVTLVFDTGIR